jgi:putative flavoprotein involved in K+ transport
MDATEITESEGAAVGAVRRDGAGPGPKVEDVVVIGAGAAGLGVAGELIRRGIEPLVLERAEHVGGGWRGRHESLRLNTVSHFNALPGARLTRAERWLPGRDFNRYLERYARELSLRIETGVEVHRVERAHGEWRLKATGETVSAHSVVVATGYDLVPEMPEWPGRHTFTGALIHSAAYRRPQSFRGQDVLVAGAGNSGTEIALELAGAGAARVRVAVRTPVNLMPEAILGVAATWFARANEGAPRALVDAGSRLIQRLAFGDLSRYGMGRAPLGVATELHVRGKGPVLDRGFVAALKRGEIELVAAVEGFDDAEVLLADRERICPDAVIAATGFSHGLEPLVGHLGVLDERGRPRERRGHPDPDNPGLFFNGYWLPLSGQLPAMQRTAPRIAKAIARRELRRKRVVLPRSGSVIAPAQTHSGRKSGAGPRPSW